MMDMFHKDMKRHSNKGQTAFEYVVLMAVIVIVILGIMKKVRDYLLVDIDKCTPQSSNVVCIWKNQFDQENSFRFFKVRGRISK